MAINNLRHRTHCISEGVDENNKASTEKIGKSTSTINKVVGSVVDSIRSSLAELTAILYGTRENFSTTNTSNTPEEIQVDLQQTCQNDVDAANPTNDFINEFDSLPKDNVESTDPILSNITKFNESKTRTFPYIIGNIGILADSTKDMGIKETRETKRLAQTAHFISREQLESVEEFAASSESIGASILAYTPDTQSLQLKYWRNYIPDNFQIDKATSENFPSSPMSVRNNLLNKLPPFIVKNINTAYAQLNINFCNNLSNEFYVERVGEISDFTILKENAHSYHIAGDFAYLNDNLKKNKILDEVRKVLYAELGDTKKYINYLFPINDNIVIDNDTYKTTINQKGVAIDKKGNNITDYQDIPVDIALVPVSTMVEERV